MITEENYRSNGMNIFIRRTNLKLTYKGRQVSFKINKKGIVTGVSHGGHYQTHGGLPGMTPFLTPPYYFLNPALFFRVSGLIDYYVKNDITPLWVGENGSGSKVVEGTWKYFIKKYKESKKVIGNNGLMNRVPSGLVDVRDFVLRYCNKVYLDFGFDTEWYHDDRYILCYQFSTTLDDIQYDFVFHVVDKRRLSLGEMIYHIVSNTFAGRGFVILNEKLLHHKTPFYESCNIRLIAHFAGVDFSMCNDYKEILKYLKHSRSQEQQLASIKLQLKDGKDKKGRSLTDDDKDKLKKRYNKINENPVHATNMISSDKHCLYTVNPRVYNFWVIPRRQRCFFKLDMRDTMKLAPPGSPLASLGESLGIEKMDTNVLDKQDNKPLNFYKENMKELRKNHFDFFVDYAIRDARISYEWYQNVKNIIGDGVTVSAIAAKHLTDNVKKEMLKYYNEYSWDKHARGFKLEDGKPNYNLFYKSRGMFGDLPDYAYIGGRNESFSHGLITGRTYDYDLRSAYPAQMQVMRMIDFDKDPIVFNEGHVLTHDDWLHIGQAGFGYVHFEFPKSVKYPTIPLKSDKPNLKGSPVFLRKGYGLVSAPDVYAAIQVGATVTVGKQGFMFFDLKRASEVDALEDFNELDVDNDFIMHPVGFGVRSMIQIRSDFAKKYGKKSVQAQLMKILVNSTYGKTGQGIHGNTARNILTDVSEVIPYSKITDGVIASTTTSLVRCVLGMIMNYIADHGYTVHSVTTDGFISDFPWNKMLEIDDYLASISTVYQKVIKACWGEDLEYKTGKGSILEVKHIQDDYFFNIKTRGNISLDKDKSYINPFTNETVTFDGVFAKAGYKGDKSFKYLSDFEKRKFLLNEVLNRDGKLIDMQSDMLSFRDVKNNSLKSITKHYDHIDDIKKGLSMDYDKKRMLQEREYSSIKTKEFKSDYGFFPTRPFEDMAEYEYNADVHSAFIKMGHNIKSDIGFLGYKKALEHGFPKFKKVDKLHHLTSNELKDYKDNFKKYEVRQFLIYLLKHGGLQRKSLFSLDELKRKDYLKLIDEVYGINALDMWKNIAKRDKHNFDYLTAIDVFNRLHKHYQFVYVEELEFEEP
ncbi:MAG: DNA-directed DNA polymerase [Streptococcus parasanguinis DORA_23_24]|nr:MAG: DNA-directed DNA polymerase [Streptococcus parasanguinis DORA_23_24]